MSELVFDSLAHRYWLDGIELPSVTKICKLYDPPSPFWTEESRIRGTEVHTLTAQFDRGEELDPELKEKHLARLNAWMKFKLETGFRPKLIEHRVANEVYRYAGTLDRRGVWHGDRRVLIDIKTGPPTWSTSFQLHGYNLALPEPTPEHYAIELKEDGSWKQHKFGDIADRALWLAAVSLFHRKERG